MKIFDQYCALLAKTCNNCKCNYLPTGKKCQLQILRFANFAKKQSFQASFNNNFKKKFAGPEWESCFFATTDDSDTDLM
jgi:hypothetical protein